MQDKFLKLLKEVHASGDNKLFQNLKAFCLQNFKGAEYQAAVREIRISSITGAEPEQERNEINFKPEDFQKKRTVASAPPSIGFVADSAGAKVGNPLKNILEKSDEEIKNKFLGENEKPSIELALNWINGIRQSAGEKPMKHKSFSKAFFQEFRASIELAMTNA